MSTAAQASPCRQHQAYERARSSPAQGCPALLFRRRAPAKTVSRMFMRAQCNRGRACLCMRVLVVRTHRAESFQLCLVLAGQLLHHQQGSVPNVRAGRFPLACSAGEAALQRQERKSSTRLCLFDLAVLLFGSLLSLRHTCACQSSLLPPCSTKNETNCSAR